MYSGAVPFSHARYAVRFNYQRHKVCRGSVLALLNNASTSALRLLLCMSLSSVVKGVGAATGNPILMTAGQIGELLGFRSRAVRTGGKKKKPKKSKGKKTAKKKRATGPRSGGKSTGNGAPVVTTTNAPVAFARNDEIRPFFKTRANADGDGVIVHAVDMYGAITGPAASPAAFSNLVSAAVNPTNTTTFPYLASTIGPGYQKYRLKLLRIHYVHYCPTSAQGSIYLSWNPDVLITLPVSSAALLNDSNSAQGAIYEDLRLDVDLRGLTVDWQFVGAGATDTRMNSAGVIQIATENLSVNSQPLGNIYFETVWEFTERKVPSEAEPVGLFRRIMCSDLEPEAKRRRLHEFVDVVPLKARVIREAETDEEAITRALRKLKVEPPKQQLPTKSLGYDRC